MRVPLLILGGGPAGYAAAFRAADGGSPVTLVESEPKLGGTCLLRGCIPSKSLLHVARVIAEASEVEAAGIVFDSPRIDLNGLRSHQSKLIQKLSTGLDQLVRRRKVTRIHARGSFEDSETLRLEGEHESIPSDRILKFDRCIVATGSVPVVPQSLAIESSRVMTSTEALQLEQLPASMLVVGGGYIGLEMATVYARLGSAVTVVESTGQLLPEVDADLVKPLHKRLANLFDAIQLDSLVTELKSTKDGIVASMEINGESQTQCFDTVLIAVGRRPNTGRLGLEATQVEQDERGFLRHNSKMQTDDPRILVAGDAAGIPMLAHKASHEGRIAAEVVLGESAEFDPQAIPAVVFTDPEIAYAGLTAREAQASGVSFETAVYPWAASGRAQSLTRTEGLTKWLVDPQTRRLLGCGIVGPGAGELIAEAVLAIEMGAVVGDLGASIHPHPTLSETMMHAVHALEGTATEIYKPRRDRKLPAK